ncbi:unnamed protein product, partial [marine sediment metagenome]
VVYAVPGSPSNKEVPAKLTTGTWDVPLLFRAGFSLQPIKTSQMQLMLSGMVVDGRDRQTGYSFGGEMAILSILYLRGGYRLESSEVEAKYSQEAGLSMGFGIDLGFVGVDGLTFDYSSLDFGRLDIIQQFSIAVGF